ncbi:MAG: ATP-binding protein [Pseudomonadota bacterium]
MPALSVPRKWRPPLALVIAALVALLITLPVLGLALARLAGNQFVRETERSLIAQSVILAEVYADALAATGWRDDGPPLPDAIVVQREDRYHPVDPVLAAKPDLVGEPVGLVPSLDTPAAEYIAIAARLTDLAQRSQKTTLAGYRFLDTKGVVVASSGEGEGMSLGHVAEVRAALEGQVSTALRYREPLDERHALSSISRDTAFRVHVAHPVIIDGRVAGAVYLIRTPIDLRKFLYRERYELARMAAVMLVGGLLIGFISWRVLSRPIRALRAQSQEVARGERAAPEPLRHYGVSELADLGESLLSMAQSLTERSDAIRLYTEHVTHELKSPVTSIVGAAELLETSGERLGAARRAQLLKTIHAEGHRMDTLLATLRDLARVRTFSGDETTRLAAHADWAKTAFSGLEVVVAGELEADICLSAEEMEIVLTQLLQNAADHGAKRVEVRFDAGARVLSVADDGEGVSEANREDIFTPFFTTKRDRGGTGMGLAITAAIAERHGGALRLGAAEAGATFLLDLPG